MKRSPDELVVIEGGQRIVRANPEMYFPRGVIAHELVSGLVQEALCLGATDIGVVDLHGWLAVGADIDWFHAGRFQAGVDDIFDRIVAFPELGQNTMRFEVLIAVAAASTITLTPSSRRVVSGSCDVIDDFATLLNERRWKRLVAFHLNSAPN